MTFLWRIPDDFPEEAIGFLEKTSSFDRFLLKEGRQIEVPNPRPVVRFSATASKIASYDCLPNSALVPLVSRHLFDALEQLSAIDIQAIPAQVVTKDIKVNDYVFLNVTNLAWAIDHAASRYTFVPGTKQIMSFRELRFRPGCLGDHHLARDVEYRSHLLVSDEVLKLFGKLDAKGVELCRPEEIAW